MNNSLMIDNIPNIIVNSNIQTRTYLFVEEPTNYLLSSPTINSNTVDMTIKTIIEKHHRDINIDYFRQLIDELLDQDV